MATQATRNRRNAPKEDAPAETDNTDVEPVVEPEAPVTDESPETDAEVDATADASEQEPETDIPTLPDGFTPNHPLVADLFKAVIEAEAAKSEPTPIADFVAAADKLFNVPVGYALAERLITADPTEVLVRGAEATYDAFKTMVSSLRDYVEVRDRAEGDDLAEALGALVRLPKGGISDESDKAAIPILVARWKASRPSSAKGTGTPRTGESEIPTLASVHETDKWTVKYECGTCKKTFSTGKDNLNSARRECIKHGRTHGTNVKEGDTAYVEMTNGLFLNGMGNPTWKGDHAETDDLVDSIQRGGWRFYTVK